MFAYYPPEWESLQSRIVGRWCPSFSGATGLQFPSTMGRNHGVLTADRNTSWQTVNGAGALRFGDGVNWQYATIPAAASPTGNAFTISVWVHCVTAGVFGNTVWWKEGHSYFYNLTANSFVVNYGATSANEFGVGASIIGRMAHVCMTYDGLIARCFVDGNLSGSRTNAAAINNTNVLSLATRTGSAAWATSGMWQDDIIIFNTALTANEVRFVYEQGRGGGMLYQPPRRRSYFAQVTTFKNYWFRNQQRMIGGGIR